MIGYLVIDISCFFEYLQKASNIASSYPPPRAWIFQLRDDMNICILTISSLFTKFNRCYHLCLYKLKIVSDDDDMFHYGRFVEININMEHLWNSEYCTRVKIYFTIYVLLNVITTLIQYIIFIFKFCDFDFSTILKRN